MEAPAVDASGGGDGADQVGGEHSGRRAGEQPDDQRRAADELERPDEVGRDLGRGDAVVVEVGRLGGVVGELAQRERHEQDAGDHAHDGRAPGGAAVGARR